MHDVREEPYKTAGPTVYELSVISMESVYFKCLADNIVNYQEVVDTWDPTDPASDPETLEYYDRMLFKFIL